MPNIRLLAVPIADRNVASSRIRLYDLVELLPADYQTTVTEAASTQTVTLSEFDVIYIQKDARPAAIDLASRAAESGVPIVYDIDDDFGCWPGMAESEMCKLARIVTADSDFRVAQLQTLTNSEVVAIPCMIDVASDPARSRIGHMRDAVEKVASFGNLVSLLDTRGYLSAVPSGMDTFVVGPGDAATMFPGTRLIGFDVDRFVTDLLDADVFILAHGEKQAPLKDNNRLVMALSLKRPVLVSPSPAYLDVLAALGLDWLACQPEQVGERLAALAEPRIRADICETGFEYAWAHYGPDRIAAKLDTVLRAALEDSR